MTGMARGTVRRGAWVVAGLIGLLVAAAPAQASYVTAEFQGIWGVQIGYTLNGTHHDDVYAGKVVWKTISSDAGFSGIFHTFCLEPNLNLKIGNQHTFNLGPINGAPVPGPAMGDDKADSVRELWAKFHDNLDTKTKAAAIQIAIWDIVYDDFTADSSAANTLAQQWLSELNGLHNKHECPLTALTNPNLQDQITCHCHETPVPPTLALAGMGLLSLCGYARPWRKRS
jgi:hypothetical protein